jgi:hypothetical protein
MRDEFDVSFDEEKVEEPSANGALRPVSMTEDEYVAQQVEITRGQMAKGMLPDKLDTRDDSRRIERCERYARWRWKEYHAGNVGSL